ncbi:fetuin-B-like isoform X1 [Chiloscyllium plagiosum]|uniref:fetuin-B-like isoform X1 n=1 Tax=Chiloscyllium plagiosum TaxID=36176 RepID=UPI001CB87930|nr:fetuin-B-like isoform X1 [Chiloscyllium plagiosum]
MRLFITLLISTQLFQVSFAASYRAISCNEARVVKAADLAVEHINADQPAGYKYTLNKIENAQEVRGKQGVSSAYLEFEVLETRCHSLNPKPVAECEVRSGPEAISGDCKVQLQINPTTRLVRIHKYRCLISPDSDDMVLSRCPSCPHRIPFNHSDVNPAVMMALQKYNRNNSTTNYFSVQQITRAASQVLAGKKVFVEFTIQETVCTKATKLQDCPRSREESATGNKGFCTASVYKPISGKEKVEVNCELYRPKVAVSSAKVVGAGPIKQRNSKRKGQRNKRQSSPEQQHRIKQLKPRSGTPRRIESSEEVQGALGFVIGSGREITFPTLPAPQNTCPGRARHFRGTVHSI